VGVEFRAEFLNFTNHPVFFLNPNQDINSANFLRSGDTVNERRRIQFALRVIF